jgi:hypothetical protein
VESAGARHTMGTINISGYLTEVSNSDAIEWDIDHIVNKYSAYRFAKMFENRFCVYSPAVQKLYPAYEILEPNANAEKILVLPIMDADSEPYNNVESHSVTGTHVRVIPGELVGRQGIYLAMPGQSGKNRALPLKEGLEELRKAKYEGRAFLPVVMNGDLREFDKKHPFFQLSLICVDGLKNMSAFERSDMANVIDTKLEDIITN